MKISCANGGLLSEVLGVGWGVLGVGGGGLRRRNVHVLMPNRDSPPVISMLIRRLAIMPCASYYTCCINFFISKSAVC